MGKRAVIIGFVLLLLSPFGKAQAANLDDHEKLPPDRIQLPGGSKEDDCDCCQKCEAARKPILPKEQEGTGLKDPCKDCCDRCDNALPIEPEKTPPDIMEKPDQ